MAKFELSKPLEQKVADNTTGLENARLGVPLAVVVEATDFTLSLAHVGKQVNWTKATAGNIAIPTDAAAPLIPVGSQITIYNLGAGVATITAAAPPALRKAAATAKALAQYARMTLIKEAADVWSLHGELAAS